MRSGSAEVLDPAVWYVERVGQPPLGPCTLEQIHEGFLSGEYAAKDRVTSNQDRGRFLTVKEASEAFQRRTATGSIHLPPRPSAEVTGFIERDEVPRPPDAADPAASLYELVQTMKEKKPAPRPVAEVRGAPEPEGFRVPGQAWLIASISLVLGLSIWVLATMVSKSRQVTPLANTPAQTAPANSPIRPATTPAATTSASTPSFGAVKPSGVTVTSPSKPVVTAPARPAVSPFANALNSARTPPPPPPSDRDRERERAEKEREKKEREERERDERDWWRARDERNQPIAKDRFGEEEDTRRDDGRARWTPGSDPGTPNLRQAHAGAAPPPAPVRGGDDQLRDTEQYR